ncbi:hypothetical protein BH11ARM1_BH11ARM1_02720 [soil metagenome]
MWVFSKTGAVSIIAHWDKPKTLIVRSRSRDHLLSFLGHDDVFNMPEADYPWRAEVDTSDLPAMLTRWGEEITYPNFKGEVDARARRGEIEAGYASALHRIWADLLAGMSKR